MRLFASFATCFAAASAAAVPGVVDYSGFKVVRLSVGNQVEKVNNLISTLGLETWKGAPSENAMADIVIPPAKVAEFDAAVADMEKVVMHEDLGGSIQEEAASVLSQVTGSLPSLLAGDAAELLAVNQSWFNSYHAYNDHITFLNDLKNQYSSQAEVFSAGNSLQGRPIQGIHFWGSAGKNVRPAIVIHGTVHAREWIGTMVVEYLAYNLLTNYASNAEIKSFVDKYDFYFMPVVNPDGFVYTQTNDRLWRKNRQSTSGSTCLGHDINRNWNFQWAVTGGASTDPCAQDFKGRAAADAPETVVHQNFLQKIKAQQGLKLFIDYHAYSQLFMSPYGYSCTALPAKNNEFQTLLSGVVSAIRAVYGTAYKYGPICSTIYKATGNSVDYVNDVVKADYTFTAELRDTGNYGFLLPANQILPTSVESYAGFRHLLVNMR